MFDKANVGQLPPSTPAIFRCDRPLLSLAAAASSEKGLHLDPLNHAVKSVLVAARDAAPTRSSSEAPRSSTTSPFDDDAVMALPGQQAVEYPSFKLVIVGDGGTGKAAFVKRHLTGEF